MEDEIVKRKRALLGDRADESCEELSDHPVSDEWLLIECDSLDCNATTDVDLVAADPARDEPLLAAGSRTLRVATSARHTRPDFRFGGAPASGPHKTIRTCSGRLPPWSQKVLMAQPVGKIEEADVLIPQRATADTARLLGAMEDLAKRGRSRGLGMTVATQRGQEVAKSVLELMETVILLRTTGPRSIKAAQDWISVNADSTGTRAREVVESLPTLRVGEAWVWSPAFLSLLQRVQLPLFETFDSHVTPRPGQARVVPKTRAEIDLKKLTAEIAATAAKAAEHGGGRAARGKSGEPAPADDLVQARIGVLEQTLRERDAEIVTLRSRLAELQAVVSGQGLDESLRAAASRIADALQVIERARPTGRQATGPAPDRAPQIRTDGQPKAAAAAPGEAPAGPARGPRTLAGDEPLRFRAGALRMVEALGRMAPRRLTKAQWAVVAKMRHTSGTWSTYFGELRRAGLLDETPDGFTLTETGFAFLGGRPEPMSGEELRQHYLGILRAGAGRMLQAVIDAYPAGLSREEISVRAGIVSSSGTFSTYWGELVRNGLVVQNGSSLTASDILMDGAGSGR